MTDAPNTASHLATNEDGESNRYYLPQRLLRHLRLFTEIDLRFYLTLVARFKSELGGTINMTELANVLGLSIILVNRSLFRLSAFGLVRVTTDVANNNFKTIRLLRDSVINANSGDQKVSAGSHSMASDVARSLGDSENIKVYEYICRTVPGRLIARALKEALAVPQSKIRKSRSSLFLHLLRRHAKSQLENSGN